MVSWPQRSSWERDMKKEKQNFHQLNLVAQKHLLTQYWYEVIKVNLGRRNKNINEWKPSMVATKVDFQATMGLLKC